MQFDSYLSDLLYRYECVIIPEFGAFITNSISAQIDENGHSFYPPKKILSFNEQLKSNDGLLANYIAGVEKIPFEIANKKIAKKTKALKSFLAEGEVLTFKNIGDLKLNDAGKFSFEPSNKVNYLTHAFGLSEFTSSPVLREVYKQEVEELEKVVPLKVSAEKRKAKPYLRYAAIALLTLTLGGFVSSNYYLNKIEQHNQVVEQEAQEQLNGKIQEATFVISNPLPAVTLNVSQQQGNYHIVAGAFRIEENSTKKLNQLLDQGYNARKIGVNKYGLHQVVYSSYTTRSEAQQALYKIRREHNKDAWLLIQELN